ncbi:MAG: hypothetical protein H0U65_07055 [Rubrobacter sp.]|jgi:hypothetical protein|nr:hypothetical protein [Rubrobacter sp.]
MKLFLGMVFLLVAASSLVGCALVEEEASQGSAEPEEVAAKSEQTEEGSGETTGDAVSESTNGEEATPEQTGG